MTVLTTNSFPIERPSIMIPNITIINHQPIFKEGKSTLILLLPNLIEETATILMVSKNIIPKEITSQ